jgi:glycine cleavage system H protein
VFPDDLSYTDKHEWLRSGSENSARIGITQFAADALSDIVYVSLPEVGESVNAGDAVAELESTKSVSDVYSPVTGEVTAVNELLETAPETINSDPYGDGWLFDIELAEPGEIEGLLDAEEYAKIAVD